MSKNCFTKQLTEQVSLLYTVSFKPANRVTSIIASELARVTLLKKLNGQPTNAFKKKTVQPALTITSPFPPLANPSFKSAGCLLFSSNRFLLYSSSIVIEATPFPRAPVTLETAPAAPPTQHSMQIQLNKTNTFR